MQEITFNTFIKWHNDCSYNMYYYLFFAIKFCNINDNSSRGSISRWWHLKLQHPFSVLINLLASCLNFSIYRAYNYTVRQICKRICLHMRRRSTCICRHIDIVGIYQSTCRNLVLAFCSFYVVTWFESLGSWMITC